MGRVERGLNALFVYGIGWQVAVVDTQRGFASGFGYGLSGGCVRDVVVRLGNSNY